MISADDELQRLITLPQSPPPGAECTPVTAQERIYHQLRHAIMIGAISPGASLTIRGLGDMLDVSPTPVREALRRLSAEGAVTVLNNRRVVTPEMNLRRFDELIALRTALECHAAERALPYINEIQIDQLEEIDQLLDQSIKENNREQIVVHNQLFHSTIYRANPEQVVMPSIESVWLQLGPYSRVALSELPNRYQVDHHRKAIDALRRRHPADLVQAIANDIADGIGQLGRSVLTR